MNKPRGYTIIEVITAVAFIFLIFLIVIIIVGPKQAIDDAYREQQLDGVRDYMEVMLELRESDIDLFYEIALQAQDEKIMIGIGDGCSGAFGAQCTDIELSNKCLNIQESLPEGFLEELAFDASNDIFSRVRTGYYILYKDEVLEVGACDPSGIDEVRLMSLIKFD